jgi:FkbM family methyltransferase
MNTKTKIATAAFLSRIVRAARGFFGKANSGIFRRGGLNWELDLRQGIDFAIFLQGGFEPGTLRDYCRNVKPGSTVLDIGANIGAHTLPLARLAGVGGRVIAFEPTDYAFRKLERNLALNPAIALRVQAVQALLVGTASGDKPAAIPSSWSLEDEGDVEIHPDHGGRYQPLSGAESVRLDDWVTAAGLEKVDFIKMDVDGYEVGVLEGAMETLAKWHPTMMMEFAPYIFAERGRSFGEVLSILRSLNYSCRTVSGRPVTLDSSLEASIPHGASMNVILEY